MTAPAEAARAFETACRAELTALKPGNVHVFAPGHGMEVAHFERAAAAAAPAICAPGLSVGGRIEAAVKASLAVAGCNTNLGIILLCAPLVSAALSTGGKSLPARLSEVLDALDVADAEAAFRAIATASPGGLGSTQEADVRGPATLSLAAAMALAADRDMIARQYGNGFAEVFSLGVPALQEAPTTPERVEDAFLAFLCAFPDSHIARKFGAQAAEGVRAEAIAVQAAITGLAGEERRSVLAAFDASLKARGLNPGTSADLTVASILAALLQRSD